MVGQAERAMVRKARDATDEDLLLAMTSGSPEADADLGFTQAVAGAELRRRSIDKYAWAVPLFLLLQFAQVAIAYMTWQSSSSALVAPSLSRIVDVVGLGLAILSVYVLWRRWFKTGYLLLGLAFGLQLISRLLP